MWCSREERRRVAILPHCLVKVHLVHLPLPIHLAILEGKGAGEMQDHKTANKIRVPFLMQYPILKCLKWVKCLSILARGFYNPAQRSLHEKYEKQQQQNQDDHTGDTESVQMTLKIE